MANPIIPWEYRSRTRTIVSETKRIQPRKNILQRCRCLSGGIAPSWLSPLLIMGLFSTTRTPVYFLHSRPFYKYHESLRVASSLCYYSPRCMLLVEYNAKRMQSKGDDIIAFGKYRGHFLHEIFRIDPSYVSWIAYKFTPRIPKQERFAEIARIYHSVHLDIQKRQARQKYSTSRFLGKEGDKVENLTLKVLRVRLEDDPYKTMVKGTTPYFYVRQILTLEDSIGNLVTFRISSRTASRESGPSTRYRACFPTR